MPTHDITLPAKVRPVFPPRCVGCEVEHPHDIATISVTGSGSSPSIKEVAIDAALGGGSRSGSNRRVTVEVPACRACKGKLEWRHFWKTVALYGGALGGVAVGFVLMALTGSVTLLLLGIGVGVLGPVIWDLRSPPEFTMTPMGDRTTYEFRSELCAKEFAAANPLPET